MNTPEQLQAQLAKQLKPIYFIYGNEPLQMGEAQDAVRQAARKADFTTREVLDADGRFDWTLFHAASASLSLFAERRIIDLRILKGTPGKEGAKALTNYIENPPPDTLLLITAYHVDWNHKKAKWFKTLTNAATSIEITTPNIQQLPAWLNRRMVSRGLKPNNDLVRLIAERNEGNLLAAAQEIDKLKLLIGDDPNNYQRANELIADSARYDPFLLVDAALKGDLARSLKILLGLKSESAPMPVIVWAFAREVRVLAELNFARNQGKNIEQAAKQLRVWPQPRLAAIRIAIKRHNSSSITQLTRQLVDCDKATKGQLNHSDWDELIKLNTLLATGSCIASPIAN